MDTNHTDTHVEMTDPMLLTAQAVTIRELRAENERWKEAGEAWVERERVLTQERDVAVQYHRDASAEIERLRETIAEWQAIHGVFTGDVHAACQTEIERLRAALEKHHDLLSDEPGDYCRTCALDYLGRDKE